MTMAKKIQGNPKVKKTYTIRNLSPEQYDWLIMTIDAMRVGSKKDGLDVSIEADNDLIDHIVGNTYLELQITE